MKKDNPWVMRTYSGHSTAKASNELYRLNLSKGQTGLSVAFDLPDTDRLRQRPRTRTWRSRQSRGSDWPHRRYGDALRRYSARSDEHVDDHQWHGGVVVRTLYRCSGTSGGRCQSPARHDAERHRQRIPFAWHLYLSTRTKLTSDHAIRLPILSPTFRSGILSTCAPTICKKPAPHQSKKSPTRSARRSRFSIRYALPAN